ncbi:MAG: helix-turn-helix transcriptional regulator [Syntrophomonadaceae bacterium]|nr:helix-turn-helix transcriptional regulator [Syntrophomonadaceae bacterium]
MSLKYMILGSLKEYPTHGYSMVDLIFRDFAEQKPEINSGQIYTLLAKMEEGGLIERKVVQQDKAPNKKVISITPEGEADFESWLRSDAEEEEYIRYDFFNKYGFLYKVNFFNKLDKEAKLSKIDRQIRRMEEKLGNFIIAEEDMAERGIDKYRLLILEYGIEAQKAKIRWLKKLRREVLKESEGRQPGGQF